jgi:hypothetical protein
MVMALAASGCSVASHAADGPSAWKLIWADNFTGPASGSVSRTRWEFTTGQGIFGTGEVETDTSSRSNIHLDGHGDLDITVSGHGAPGSPGASWTSARIGTRRLFGAPAGGEMMVTASIEQPDPVNALGYWPGFWMLGPGKWPQDGEVDIMEDVNGLSQEAGTLHCGNLTQRNPDGTFGPCHEEGGLGSGLRACTGCQLGFHTYTVIIDRRDASDQQIRWYLDGHEFYSVRESRVGPAAWTAAVDHGLRILLDVAVGGSYPDARCRCTAPGGQSSSQGTMAVRYVDVYTN